MKNIMRTLLFGCSLIFLGCASIPPTTVTLTQEIVKEAEEMHQLNVVLVNQLFEERKQVINAFITNEYTPTIIKKYEALLPDSLDYRQELPNIMKSIIPVINRKKDSLQQVLSLQQQDIIVRLNTNYTNYNKATTALQNLIDSAVKLKAAENNALSTIQSLTGDSADVKKIQGTIDRLLLKSGTDMGKLLEVNTLLKQH